ncbi:hypothetical protein V8E52_008096 [Russula decolorans]
MRAELDARNERVAQLEYENRRWQERNGQLLTKHDHVHPTEFQSLNDEIESLKEVSSGDRAGHVYLALDRAARKELHRLPLWKR